MKQIELIKNHLEIYGNITSWEAIQLYRITRLAAIIHTLRGQGETIDSEHMEQNGKKFVNYKIKQQ